MSPRTRSRTIVRGLLAGLGALAISVPGLACGDGYGDGGSGTSTTSSTAAEAGGGEAGAVEAFDFGFGPVNVTVSAGDTVTWENTGETTHNVKGKGFFSDGLAPGDSFEHRFTSPGTYDYLCTLHPDTMQGTVVVK